MSSCAALRAVVAAWLIFIATIAASAATAQLKTDSDDALLFSVQLGTTEVGSSVRAFNTRAGVCLDLQDTIDALQIAITIDTKAGTASGWAFQESRRIAIDRARRQAEFGGQRATLTDETIWESRSGWCVRAVDLGKWLGVEFDIDITNAVLGVRSTGALPIEAAIRRAALANRLQGAPTGPAKPLLRITSPYRAWRAPWIDVNLGLAAERPPGGPVTMTPGYEIYAAGELAYFSADARLVSTHALKPDSLRLRLYRADPDSGLLGPVHATQMALGDVAGFSTPLVAQSAFGRGAAVTNRPLERSNDFDTIDFTGAVPAGWDVELYRNAELIGAAKAGPDGRYAFRRIAMRFGTNIFEIASYGPQGQVRHETKVYNIAQQAVPPGETWWWADAVQEGRDLFEFAGPAQTGARQIGWRQDAGFEHGLGRGFSAGAAVHHLDAAKGSALFVDGTIRGGIGPMLAQIDIAHANAGGTAARLGVLGHAFGASVSLEALRNNGLQSQQLSADLTSRVRLAIDKPTHVAGLILPIHFDIAEIRTVGGATVEANSRISTALAGFSASLTAGWQRLSPTSGQAESAGSVGLLFNTRVRGVRLRGEALWSVKSYLSLADVQVAANWNAGRSSALEASTSYAPAAHAFSVGGSYTRDFKRFGLTVGGDVDSRGHAALRVNLLASFGAGKGWGRISSRPQATSGALAVTLFRDDNGDGKREPGEAALPGGIQINDTPLALRAADKGHIGARFVGALDPSVPVKVSVDTASLADPFDVPATDGVMVIPRAGMTTAVELGIVGTGAIEGTLSDAGSALSGALVELVDANDVVVSKVRTEYDGYFIFERVRYGHYLIRSSAPASPRPITVTLNADRPSVRLAWSNAPQLASAKR
ncbi:carboxypeptidase-like regulatory domain-containing protein [Sphingomonas sp. AR_OL41]|uniref:carboxypeptidase-like regulatory domain-containing protein n=1 Tax=Sphingomonas sp. AR_OL41 TaxID=3042729 RepID=UPI0024807C14|nr:carboxypeptidase-like regulatory domain-containing protein [Sphingomonas sp. AR_OL41]MDH7973273.1 carboxypeptidase-like regulatory domain-containing protein [Sphingomonas sp. AR_OL41]